MKCVPMTVYFASSHITWTLNNTNDNDNNIDEKIESECER